MSPAPAQVAALDDPGTRGLDDLVVGYTGTQDDVLAMEALGLNARPVTAAELDAGPTLVDTLDVLWGGSSLGLSDGSAGDAALKAWADAGHGVIGRGAAGLDAASTYGPVVATGSSAGSSSNAIVALTTPEGSPRTTVRIRTAEAAGHAVGRVLVLVDGEVERAFRVRRKTEGARAVTLRLPSGRVEVQVLFRGDDLRAPSRSGTKHVTVG